ncbi:hypothetical protein D3C80_1707660 [compost metagenome]
MRVNLRFQSFHLRIHCQNLVLVAFPDKIIDVLHHFVVFGVEEADFIHPFGLDVGSDKFVGFVLAHNDGQARYRLGNPIGQEYGQQNEDNGTG